MRKRLLLCLIITASITVSCKRQVAQNSLFNADSLITAQVHALSDLEAMLEKQATIDGVTNKNVPAALDTIGWKSELEIFRQMALINNPANRRLYLVDDGLFDPHSNLTVKAISALEEDLPVRYVRIFYSERVSRPRKIEALFREDNSLLHSSRVLTMEFQLIDGKHMLTDYNVTGGQKMIMSDTVTYEVEGKILFDKKYGQK